MNLTSRNGGQHFVRIVHAQVSEDVDELSLLGVEQHAECDVHGLQVLTSGLHPDAPGHGADAVDDRLLNERNHEVCALASYVRKDASQPVEYDGSLSPVDIVQTLTDGRTHSRHANPQPAQLAD